MKKKLDFDVVIPCFKSSEVLSTLIGEIVEVKITKFKLNRIILVLDGIDLETKKFIFDLKKKYKIITVLQLAKNYGQLEATRIGFEHSSSNIVITIDDDGQHPLQGIKKILSKYENKDFDLIYLNPSNIRAINLKFVLSRIFKYVLFLIDDDNKKYLNSISFRVINREKIWRDYIINKRKYTFYSFEKCLIISSNKIFSELIKYNLDTRKNSRYSIIKYFILATHLIFLTRLKKSLFVLYLLIYLTGFLTIKNYLMKVIFFFWITTFHYIFLTKRNKYRQKMIEKRDVLSNDIKILK